MINSSLLRKGPCVYIITSNSLHNYYKLGSSLNITQRIKSYHTPLPGKVYVKHIQYFSDKKSMILAEKLLQYSLGEYRDSPNKEWFNTNNPVILVNKLTKISSFVNTIKT